MTRFPAPRALYVHVPFCHTICGYCDFYSEVLRREATGPLVDALLAELARFREQAALEWDSVFVGGGTPTTLPPQDLARLLTGLGASATEAEGVEFTVEANPATVGAEVADTLVAAGVNRVSIGAQSFDAAELRVLERLHAPEQVVQTVKVCREAGLERINLDLIFAIPGQTLESWRSNLRTAVGLGAEHLSCYGLTYERGTPLYEQLQSGQMSRCELDLEAAMYELAIEYLAEAGYRQYEISNYARPGGECRHNLAYWRNESYVGIGPAAAGFVDGVRYKNVPDTAAYVAAIQAGRQPRIEEERLPPDRAARETAMLGLRLNEGIDRQAFALRFKHDPAALFAGEIERHVELGLLVVDEQAVRLTRAGRLVADSVIADFL